MHQIRSRVSLSILVLVALLPLTAFAKSESEPIARMGGGGAAIEWAAPSVEHDAVVMTVLLPDGTRLQREFKAGTTPMFRLVDIGGRAIDGTYTYELRIVPKIAPSVRQALAAARQKDDGEAVARIQREAGLDQSTVQSGAFSVKNGALITPNAEEPRSDAKASASRTPTTAAATGHNPSIMDVVTADDAIIQGSLCVGLDCVNNESFGFDTIRLKENNTRIKFDDTSSSAGFPNNDWQLTANDSASGGANKFSIEDITGSKVPFTVTAGAPTNSLFVASTGKLGLGNSSPGLHIHITATDTPAIRQEQTNGGGFTAQTWDIGANEANWFVRDVTGGSRLPLRIRPGAPTSSVDIAASGFVGIGTASPGAQIDVRGGSDTQGGNGIKLAQVNDSTRWVERIGFSNGALNYDHFNGSAWSTPITVLSSGNVGLFVTNPTNPLQHSSGAFLSAGGTWTNASSRDFKTDITDLSSAEAACALTEMKPVKYVYKVDPTEHHVGFIAEDVPDLVATKDRKGLSPMDVVAVLTQVVKDQQRTIDDMKSRLDQLEKKQ